MGKLIQKSFRNFSFSGRELDRITGKPIQTFIQTRPGIRKILFFRLDALFGRIFPEICQYWIMYLRKDGNDPSLQQLSFRQMFQQLIFQHDLAHLVLSMDF